MHNRFFCKKNSELESVIYVYKRKLAQLVENQIYSKHATEVTAQIFYLSLARGAIIQVKKTNEQGVQSKIGNKHVTDNDINALNQIVYQRNKAPATLTKISLSLLMCGILFALVGTVLNHTVESDKVEKVADALIYSAIALACIGSLYKIYQLSAKVAEKCHSSSLLSTTLSMAEIHQFCTLKANQQFNKLRKGYACFKKPNVESSQVDLVIAACDFGTISKTKAKQLLYQYLHIKDDLQEAELSATLATPLLHHSLTHA
jgi:hypothetical protein